MRLIHWQLTAIASILLLPTAFALPLGDEVLSVRDDGRSDTMLFKREDVEVFRRQLPSARGSRPPSDGGTVRRPPSVRSSASRPASVGPPPSMVTTVSRTHQTSVTNTGDTQRTTTIHRTTTRIKPASASEPRTTVGNAVVDWKTTSGNPPPPPPSQPRSSRSQSVHGTSQRQQSISDRDSARSSERPAIRQPIGVQYGGGSVSQPPPSRSAGARNDYAQSRASNRSAGQSGRTGYPQPPPTTGTRVTTTEYPPLPPSMSGGSNRSRSSGRVG